MFMVDESAAVEFDQSINTFDGSRAAAADPCCKFLGRFLGAAGRECVEVTDAANGACDRVQRDRSGYVVDQHRPWRETLDAAFELTGGPLVVDDGDLDVDPAAAREMKAAMAASRKTPAVHGTEGERERPDAKSG